MTRCPSSELLQQLLADRLTGPEAEALEGHVEACSSCQQLLEQWTRNTHEDRGEEPVAPEESGAAFLHRLEQEPAAAALASPPLSKDTAAPSDLPQVPGYEILEELGHGGMGLVYRARGGQVSVVFSAQQHRPQLGHHVADQPRRRAGASDQRCHASGVAAQPSGVAGGNALKGRVVVTVPR